MGELRKFKNKTNVIMKSVEEVSDDIKMNEFDNYIIPTYHSSPSLLTDKDGFPIYKKENCEHFYKCINHCKSKALSLSKYKIVRKQLNNEFFKNLVINFH